MVEGGGGNQLTECVYDDSGHCGLHGQGMKKLKPGKVWAKGRNGLYGWKYTKTVYWVCGTVTRAAPSTTTPTFVSMSSTFPNSTRRRKLIASSQRCKGGINGSRLVNEKNTDEN